MLITVFDDIFMLARILTLHNSISSSRLKSFAVTWLYTVETAN